jgi:hypothetical protein
VERVRKRKKEVKKGIRKNPDVIGVPPFCSQVGGKPGCEKITA